MSSSPCLRFLMPAPSAGMPWGLCLNAGKERGRALAHCPREGRTQPGAPWLPAGFKLKPCRMLAGHLGSGIDDVPLLVIITKNKYIWTRKPCTKSFALWREKGAGPIYETLVAKGQSIVPGCGFEPQLSGAQRFWVRWERSRGRSIRTALSGQGLQVLARSLGLRQSSALSPPPSPGKGTHCVCWRCRF